MFIVQPFEAPELGNASFVVADPDERAAVVIDAFRDVESYLDYAETNGFRIKRALDTHTHNDFVSGTPELAALAGIGINPLGVDGEYQLGRYTLKALHTPGHTPDHKSYLLVEGSHPRALFSGGAVMVGGIARTDLFGPHLATRLALEAWHTIQVRLRGLPDDLAVFPTHGGGSFCSTGAGVGHQTTLGRERSTNPFFETTEVMQFLARILDQRRFPTYYRDMGALNVQGVSLLGRTVPPLASLTADQVARLIGDGAAVVDIRPGREYDGGHIPGSYNVALEGGPFSAWVGWLIPRDRRIVLVGGSTSKHVQARRQLLRIGFDGVDGELDGGMEVWEASGRQLSEFETAEVEEMAGWILSGREMTLLDTRDDHEWSSGHAPGAVHIYVPDIPNHAADIPRDAPVAVHCGVGYRAGIAASLLEQAGLKGIIHVHGSFPDWASRHLAGAATS